MRWTQEHTRLPLHTKVRCLYKGGSLASFWVTRVTPEISFRRTVTTGSIFQWHRMGGKTLLTCVTQSACSKDSLCHSRGERQLCSSQQVQWLHSKQTGIMGAMSEQLEFLMFWTFKEILKETDPGPSFSQLDALSPVSAFKRVWALLPYHKRLRLGRNGCQVNQFYPL